MGSIIDRSPTDGNEIVRIVTSLDMQSGIIFRIGLHARQQLGIVHRIRIAENTGHIVHQTHIDDVSTLYLFERRTHFLSSDFNSLELVMMKRVGNYCRHAFLCT